MPSVFSILIISQSLCSFLCQSNRFLMVIRKQTIQMFRFTNLLQIFDLILFTYRGMIYCRQVTSARNIFGHLKLVSVRNIPWKDINQHIHGRSQKMCYSRYRRLQAQARQRWSVQDEQRLKELVLQQGENWKDFVSYFPRFTWRQIRQKYINYLRPDLSHDDWTPQEDEIILHLISRFGNFWKKIQTFMPRRSDNQIKNRYYGRLKKLIKQKGKASKS